MNKTRTIGGNADDELNLLDILIVLARHKRKMIGVPFILAAVAAVISLLLPNVYLANAKMLPPQAAQSGAAAIMSQLGGMAGVVAGGAGLKSPNDLYIAMLKSRSVSDALIKRFDLKNVYGTDSQEKARSLLKQNTAIDSGKDGLISVEVLDEDQKLVAKLANAYVDELSKLTKVLAVTEAGRRRLFFERQLELSKDNLASAEVALKGALDSGGVISVDADSRVMVETVGRLRAQISAKEIQLGSMRAFVTAKNPEYKRVLEELASLRSELSKLENGRPGVAGAERDGSKAVGLENIKILRDVKYHQMLFELLAKQYEIARLDEAKDPAVIQVLDPAVEPERKHKPARTLIVLLAGFAGVLLALAWALISEAKERALKAPEGRRQWDELRSHFLRKEI